MEIPKKRGRPKKELASVNAPRLRGQPTKYKPEYCQMLIDHMAQGYSMASFSGEIEVDRDTVKEWVNVHADFSAAKNIAMNKSLKFWEKQGIVGLWQDKDGPKFNGHVWGLNMRNRHGWDKQEDTQVVNVNQPQIVLTMPDNGKSIESPMNEYIEVKDEN